MKHRCLQVSPRAWVAACLAGTLAAVILAGGGERALATAPDYGYTAVAELPQPAPGIPNKHLVRDFEINAMSQSGGLVFGADFHSTPFVCQPGAGNCPAAEGEGFWAMRKNGTPNLVLYAGGTDPDGELLGATYYGPGSGNDSGDAAVTWPLLPAPPGPSSGNQHVRLHAGVYRYDAASDQVTVVAKTGSPAPGGGTFAGASSTTSMNGRGDVAFLGITEDTDGTFSYNGTTYGVGVYLADNQNRITPIAVPGDPAPEGGVFALARNPNVNDRGDVAFDGRRPTDGNCTNFTCTTTGIYVRWASSGAIEKVAGVGDVAPIPPYGSVAYKDYLYGPFVNNRGQVIFVGGVDDPYALPLPVPATPTTRALFYAEDGEIQPIVYPGLQVTTTGGDSFTLWRTSFVGYNHDIGNDGTVAFSAQYLADANNDGVRDSAVFVWKNGEYTLVAKTGDTLTGIGVVREILAPASVASNSQSRPSGGVQLNSRGQVAFEVTLEATPPDPGPLGIGALIVASPNH